MQVVILAAGRGDRFFKAGYTTPKPLIKARGLAMVTHAMAQVRGVSAHPVVLCPEALQHDIWRAAPTDIVPTVIGVRYVQSGAAMSLLAATGALDETQPVMIVDCDSVIDPALIVDFAQRSAHLFAAQKAASSLLCFTPEDDSSRYSFVCVNTLLTDDIPSAEYVAEKRRVGPVATCGVHAFSMWSALRGAICRMVQAEDTTNGEYYLAPAHNYIQGRRAVVMTEPGQFIAVGTPEQLEAYEKAAVS